MAFARSFAASPGRAPPLPPGLDLLGDWFCELGVGSEPVSFTEIKAWAELNHIQLTIWQVGILKAMNNEYVVARAEKGSGSLTDNNPTISTHDAPAITAMMDRLGARPTESSKRGRQKK